MRAPPARRSMKGLGMDQGDGSRSFRRVFKRLKWSMADSRAIDTGRLGVGAGNSFSDHSEPAMKLAGALTGRAPGLWLALEMHIERHRRADKFPQGRLVDLLVFVDVDRASDISFKARVEQASGVLQCGSFGKCHLDGVLVGLSRADDACVRPDGSSPLPLFHDLSVRLAYDGSYSRECFPAPIAKFPDPLVDQSRCRFHSG